MKNYKYYFEIMGKIRIKNFFRSLGFLALMAGWIVLMVFGLGW